MRYSGIIEVHGLPTRPKLKNAAQHQSGRGLGDADARRQRPPAQLRRRLQGDRKFALAAASLRQALQDMPEITEVSKHIMIEETKQGLNIEIVDQDGRSMFPEGAKEPYERTRKLIQKLAPALKAMPYPHLDHRPYLGEPRCRRSPAMARGNFPPTAPMRCARFSRREGVPTGHIFMVAGKADTQPLFPDDPYIVANRRVTITLMREEPPLPADFKP